MRLILDSEQEQLRTGLRKLLDEQASSERVRAAMESESGHDPALWRRIAAELGLAGLTVPEEHGGAGAGQVERAVVLEELGRSLAPVPYLASAVLAVDALLAAGDPALQADLLPGLASGERTGALAVSGPDGSWGSSAGTVRATRAQDGDGSWELTGTASHVLSGAVADTLLVWAGTPEGPAWFAVDAGGAGARGLTARDLAGTDPTRRFSRLGLDRTPARRAEGGAEPAAALEELRSRAELALAAGQVGVMGKVLETTAEYAKVRMQFGRAIGSYQGVKHPLADLYSAREQALSAVRYAAWAGDESPERFPVAAATAIVLAAPAAFEAAAKGVQLHGGIGYTWEHDAHLYYKRAKSDELLLGEGPARLDRLADLLDRRPA
ncbi:acyl-CoA dehydrogenase family protein [Phaeacidiphilus oryzae]|uniref:acyl-CoA dehydrogenase family protein n=1 Tax=Phaeacidiphilus oryzae TaxID=348818 RepID=UPI000560B765|nr:acyl-CoA dehydrogenase family protein [Phaeacidiphilus oryzae]